MESLLKGELVHLSEDFRGGVMGGFVEGNGEASNLGDWMVLRIREVGSAGVGRVEAMGERRRPKLSSWVVCPDLTESPDVWLQNLYGC